MASLIPGEIQTVDGDIELNVGRPLLTIKVTNTGDRPIQVGSHYHFAETNPALDFDRAATRGFRLDIAAGTAVRFEPGQGRTVGLVALDGSRKVYGFRQDVMGKLGKVKATVIAAPTGPVTVPAPTAPSGPGEPGGPSRPGEPGGPGGPSGRGPRAKDAARTGSATPDRSGAGARKGAGEERAARTRNAASAKRAAPTKKPAPANQAASAKPPATSKRSVVAKQAAPSRKAVPTRKAASRKRVT